MSHGTLGNLTAERHRRFCSNSILRFLQVIPPFSAYPFVFPNEKRIFVETRNEKEET